ncbi:hypothetical protein E3Q18_02516 [Wallemia mellicola]|uniref:PAC domain-containing protein n=1 Tax=Wallemia mellicola TaxID=1708541 RepID=A0A4T0TJ80_9BASI|nr:hypothetical protein E3Q23_02855 [Wallemia mellicola]TIB83617.1 hypothetical protein E3Q21_02800 [Wallemia mellicola]TIB86542.1 hypothetical protein E3Q20_02792 [Wallemia mellicola]TIB97595.1 hypothetical protein E3Q18_02516 [Wallemia mellicola]TIC29946.1 hypothetical protein E3Q10_02338 [Wallemia mellicola]
MPVTNDHQSDPGTPPISPPITNTNNGFIMQHSNGSRVKSTYDNKPVFQHRQSDMNDQQDYSYQSRVTIPDVIDEDDAVYKSAQIQRRSDLANWAPSRATPAQQSSNIANLPDWRIIEADRKAQTSMPTSLVQADLDYSMRHLLSEKVFEELIRDPLGRHRFREYLEQAGSSSIYKLDYWTDVDVFERIIGQLRAGSQALHDLYIAPSSTTKVDMPPNQSEVVFHRLRYLNELDSGLFSSQANLLHSLYEVEFQNFIRHKLIERSKVRLGKENLSDLEKNGLGDSFVLTNPRLRDHPIVMSSLGFTKVTGFDRTTIIGRNCRFLQGPGTAPAAVQRIRDALNNAEPITELLLNYRRDGTPFFCLVNIIPLRDTKGQVAYFIGGQVNVTGILSSRKNLSFLVGGSAPFISTEAVSSTAVAFSPTMQRYNNHEKQPEKIDRVGAGSVAAGSFDDRSIQDSFHGARAFDHFQPEPEKSGNIFSRIFNSSQARKEKKALDKGAQRLPGAENMLGKEAQPIEKQMEFFNHTYNKLMIVKREKREIVFVTKELLDDKPEAGTSKSIGIPPLEQRLQYHRTKGNLLRQPPSNKVNIDKCTNVKQLEDIISRFDRLSAGNLVPTEKIADNRGKAQKRLEELRENGINEDMSKLSINKGKYKETPVDSRVFISVEDSLNLQREEHKRQETQRMVDEMMSSSKVAQQEAAHQFNFSDSDDSDDEDEDDDNWLLPSYAKRKTDQAEELQQLEQLDIQDDELTNAHIDAAGALLERGDT